MQHREREVRHHEARREVVAHGEAAEHRLRRRRRAAAAAPSTARSRRNGRRRNGEERRRRRRASPTRPESMRLPNSITACVSSAARPPCRSTSASPGSRGPEPVRRTAAPVKTISVSARGRRRHEAVLAGRERAAETRHAWRSRDGRARACTTPARPWSEPPPPAAHAHAGVERARGRRRGRRARRSASRTSRCTRSRSGRCTRSGAPGRTSSRRSTTSPSRSPRASSSASSGATARGKSTLLKCLAGHLRRRRRARSACDGRLSTFIELGVGFNPDLAARDNVLINGDHARPLAAARRARASTRSSRSPSSRSSSTSS